MPRAATAAPPKVEHTFYSRHRKLRLVRVPQAVVPDNWGGQTTREKYPGVTRSLYEFEAGQLTVVDGQDVFPDGPGGEDQDAVQWLRSHDEFNVRFHEEGHEPDRPLPSDEDFHRMLRSALVQLDADKVTELLRNERDSHNREQLVKAADQTRKEILQLRQEYEAQDGAA